MNILPAPILPSINLQEPGAEVTANGVSAESWVEQAGSGHLWQWRRAMLGNPEVSSHCCPVL